MTTPMRLMCGYASSSHGTFTFSVGGRRVLFTRTTSGDNFMACYSTPAECSARKKYYEVVLKGNSSGSSYVWAGVSNWYVRSYNTSTADLIDYTSGNGAYKESTQNANNTLYTTWAVNDVIGIAWDPTTGKVWFAKNNVWQNSTDPNTNTGGITATNSTNIGRMTAMVPVVGVAFTTGAQTADVQANFAAADQVYAAPTGFSAWDTGSIPTQGGGTSYPSWVVGDSSYVHNGWQVPPFGSRQANRLINDKMPVIAVWPGAERILAQDYIDGYVDVANVAASREVRLYDQDTGMFIASTWSRASDGYFRFDGADPRRKYYLTGHDFTLTYNGTIQDQLGL